MSFVAGEAESMVRKGGLYVNYERVESTDEKFSKDKHIIAGNATIIRIGKITFVFKCTHF